MEKINQGQIQRGAQGARAPLSLQYILKPFITAAFAEFNACTEIFVVIITYVIPCRGRSRRAQVHVPLNLPQFPLLAQDRNTLIEQSLTHTAFVIMPILNFK